MGCATGLGIPHAFLAVAAAAHPTPAPAAPRGPSSPDARRFLPVRVDTLEVLHLEHKDELHEGEGCTDDLATARLHRVASAAPARLVVIP